MDQCQGHFWNFVAHKLKNFLKLDVIILFRSTGARFALALQSRDIIICSSEFTVSRVVYLRRTSVAVSSSIVVVANTIVVVVVAVTGVVYTQSLIMIVLCGFGLVIAGQVVVVVVVVTHVIKCERIVFSKFKKKLKRNNRGSQF